MALTLNARNALHRIHAGSRAAVTNQMIDRLSRDRLIDFDPRQGWFVTDAGLAAMGETA